MKTFTIAWDEWDAETQAYIKKHGELPIGSHVSYDPETMKHSVIFADSESVLYVAVCVGNNESGQPILATQGIRSVSAKSVSHLPYMIPFAEFVEDELDMGDDG